jgi:serine protease Do
VQVLAGERRVALGLVVAAGGFVVTKASALGPTEKLACVAGGVRISAVVIGTDESNDLALLRADARELPAVEWAEATPRAGALLATPNGSGAVLAAGILSSAPYLRSRERGYLGIELHQEASPPRIRTVQAETAAAAAGLAAEDVILGLDGEEFPTRRELISALGTRRPGTPVVLRIERDGQELELDAVLRADRRAERSTQEALWGPLSEVRTGFGTVLQHDTVLAPEDCGGPVVGLDGLVVGVNIARAGRVETLALPPSTIRDAVVRILRAASAAEAAVDGARDR